MMQKFILMSVSHSPYHFRVVGEIHSYRLLRHQVKYLMSFLQDKLTRGMESTLLLFICTLMHFNILRHCAPFWKNYSRYWSHIQKPTFQGRWISLETQEDALVPSNFITHRLATQGLQKRRRKRSTDKQWRCVADAKPSDLSPVRLPIRRVKLTRTRYHCVSKLSFNSPWWLSHEPRCRQEMVQRARGMRTPDKASLVSAGQGEYNQPFAASHWAE